MESGQVMSKISGGRNGEEWSAQNRGRQARVPFRIQPIADGGFAGRIGGGRNDDSAEPSCRGCGSSRQSESILRSCGSKSHIGGSGRGGRIRTRECSTSYRPKSFLYIALVSSGSGDG